MPHLLSSSHRFSLFFQEQSAKAEAELKELEAKRIDIEASLKEKEQLAREEEVS